jgi:Ni,Fe-hydrogenase III large subunit
MSKIEEVYSCIRKIYASEILEYEDKNWLHGDNAGRSLERQEELRYALDLIESLVKETKTKMICPAY